MVLQFDIIGVFLFYVLIFSGPCFLRGSQNFLVVLFQVLQSGVSGIMGVFYVLIFSGPCFLRSFVPSVAEWCQWHHGCFFIFRSLFSS